MIDQANVSALKWTVLRIYDCANIKLKKSNYSKSPENFVSSVPIESDSNLSRFDIHADIGILLIVSVLMKYLFWFQGFCSALLCSWESVSACLEGFQAVRPFQV